MGKTAFALNILKNMAVDQKKSVALFSLEMSSEQIADRVLSMVSGIPMGKIAKGQLDTEDFTIMGESMELLSETNIYIDDK
jgi:replicative DNA helicase